MSDLRAKLTGGATTLAVGLLSVLVALLHAAPVVGQTDSDALNGHELDPTCEAGLAAFQDTVYTKVRRDCAGCHGDGSPIRAFAGADAAASYFMLRNYVSFASPERSLLVQRAGNGHCRRAVCNQASGDEMRALVSSWWSGGEHTCKHNGSLFTGELPVPSDLPGRDEGFAKMTWDLGDIRRDLEGILFSLEAQRFVAPSASAPGAYRVRRPRLEVGARALRVRGLRVLVNRKHDVRADAYTTIDQAVAPGVPPPGHDAAPYPLLAAESMIVLQELPSGDRLSLSFDGLEDADPQACRDLALFQTAVAPDLATGGCAACHGGDGSPGTAPANVSLNLALPGAGALCASLRQRLHWWDLSLSTLVMMPLRGALGHPVTFADPSSVLQRWRQWGEAERENGP